MKSNINKDEILSGLNTLFNSKTENQLIERDALMLQANYLSEIERLMKEKGINRKDIALKINTSPSYLTQVFRGDKPLNFITLAKIKRALDLKFDVKASFKSGQAISVIDQESISNLPPTAVTEELIEEQLKEAKVRVNALKKFSQELRHTSA